MLPQLFLKQLLGNDSGLRKAIHSLLNLVVDVSVQCCNVYKMVALDNINGHEGNL